MPPQQPQPEQPTQPPVPPATIEPMPMQPTPAPQPAANPLTPLFQTEGYHMPDGNFSIFGYRKARIVVYPGWLVVYNASDNAEVKRVPLAQDLKMKNFLGFTRIAQVNGQKFGVFSMKYSFFLASIWSYVPIFVGILMNFIFRMATIGTYPRTGQDIFLQNMGFILVLAGFVWMALSIPKGKALIDACKRAAGIA